MKSLTMDYRRKVLQLDLSRAEALEQLKVGWIEAKQEKVLERIGEPLD